MILCVTGPMAAGKNAASAILEQKGFAAVDADLLGHQAIENARDQILKEFGPLAQQKGISLTDSQGKINRRALGSILFADPKLIAAQEAIVYPEINRLFDLFIEENSSKDIVVNATVLYKVPLMARMDAVLYVDCPAIIRLYRAKKRDSMPLKQILQRFRSQKNLFAKYKKANADTRRVWNTGSRKALENKITAFLSALPQGKNRG